MTREEWLTKAAKRIEAMFAEAGHTKAPAYRVSCGFPSRGARGKSIGECWASNASTDKHCEMFISPLIDNAVRALDILVHEMVHAYLGNEAGHGPAFRRLATALGLEGKMTATVASPALVLKLQKLREAIGEYPHAALRAAQGGKKQTTRLLKAACPVCGYTIRVTQKWADMGMPLCPCGHEFQLEKADDE